MSERKIKVGSSLKAWARGLLKGPEAPAVAVKFAPPTMLPGVIPSAEKLAMDEGLTSVYGYANSAACEYDGFIGYPTLAQLTQRPEYRMLSEKTAMAMIRKWVRLKSKGDGDKTDKINQLTEEMERLSLRELFGECAKHDGFFGRAQLFIDMGQQEGPTLEIPLFVIKDLVKGKLRKFKFVEAMYTYPNVYNASNPLADDYYNPQSWFVMGTKVHRSRMLTFIGRPVPDILKPAYNFGGMSMSQLAMPYVNNWLRTRTSVGKLISNFSTSGVKTNMAAVLAGDSGEDLLARSQLFTEMRDNQGVMLLDNETEEFFQVNTPLTTLDALQAQSQEHMSSVSSVPLSVLLGITPTGLNASTDGEIRTWYDHVLDMQNVLFNDNLQHALDIVQMSMWGEIDHDIAFEFVPLWQQSETEAAVNRKSDAEAAAIYVEMGAVAPEEVRTRLANDENSGYNGLTSAPPEMPDTDNEEEP